MKSELEKKWGSTSGLLMLAGGEGHRGHREAAEIMAREVNTVIFAFEEPEYLEKHKERGEFLPLNVRLSMWNLSPYVHFLTVLPSKEDETDMNTHYEDLFVRSGANCQFVEIQDPQLRLKQARRADEISLGENVYVQEYSGVRTSSQVRKLIDNESERVILSYITTISIHESIFEL